MQPQLSQLREQGRQAFERRDYAGALVLFRQILEQHPGFADIRHYTGLCLAFLGRPDKAIAELDEALAHNPAYVEAHINRALLLQDLGRYDEARESFELAGEFEQDSHGRFPAAVTARLANAHAAVGDLYLEAGALAEAAQAFALALGLRPRFHDIRNKYARTLLGMGRAAEAEGELRRVLDWNPRFIVARLNLGLALYRLGRRAEAASEWRLCQEQQPAHPQVRAYIAMLEHNDARLGEP
jgi:tetratricopeptide (TPR) repeat protein